MFLQLKAIFLQFSIRFRRKYNFLIFGGCWSPLPSSDENHRSQEVDDPSKILQIEADVDGLLNVENKAPKLMNLT